MENEYNYNYNFSEWPLEELYDAYHKARLGGKRKTEDEHRFEINEIDNIVNLRNAILARSYHPSSGVAFIIRDPKIREVFAAPFIDRTVHHLLFKYANMWWDRRLWKGSYSCRVGKGTLYGINDLARNMRSVSENNTRPAYVITRDLKGYFMSLNHDKLYKRILWGMDRQFAVKDKLYQTLKYLWHEIIYDDPRIGVTIRGSVKDWDDLPADKTLLFEPEWRGIVIGNLTSQLLSNIFLDQLDRYIVHTLGYKHYGRYVDDFYVVVTLEELPKALNDMAKAEKFLMSKLGLRINDKKSLTIDIHDGVEFLGARVYWDHVLPGERLCENYAKAAYKFATQSIGSEASLSSFLGLLSQYHSHKVIKKIHDSLGWDYNFGK
ncbi:RNA-directed DNA polymerase [Candidatus Saccharibacteria bacterium]|nr:RNA-directed DNA polymerase [Candidatus Saccharibacteria bacterium]